MMQLELENGFQGDTVDPAAVRTALQTLNNTDNTFAILSWSDDKFLQTAAQDDGFIIERRNGSYNAHFYAARPGRHGPLQNQSWLIPRADLGQDRFTLEEVIDIFSAEISGTAPKVVVDWVRMDMPDPGALGTKASIWARMAVWATMIAIFTAVLLWLTWKRYHP